MELVERLPTLKIAFLKDMTFKEFKKYCSSNAKSEDERKKQYDILQGFCKANIKSRGQMTRIYSFTQKTPLEVGGRLYCGNSLQGMGKQFRGFLCDGIMTDIDMKNAHPTIARYLCKLHGIPCPNLSYYIENRDEILSQFGSDGKEMFLKALNDDKLNKKEKNKIFKDFDKECKEIQTKITEIEDYAHIVKSVPDTKLYNWLGSAFNRIMCVYENKILHSLISILNKKQIEISFLSFDGLMMYGDHYTNNDLLQEVTETIETQWVGLNMKWSYKQHTTDIEMPDEWEIPKPTNESGVWNDKEAAELVYELYPHWVYCLGDLYVYDKSSGKWDSSETAHFRVIMTLTDKLFVLTEDKEGISRTKKSYGNDEVLMKKIPKLIKPLCEDNNWINIQQYSSLGKILFTNGYYDFKQGKFYEKGKDGFDAPEILFMNRINRSFDPFDDEEIDYIEDIKKRFFHDPLGVEMGNYMALNLARGLAGDKMKRVIFGLGGTNCGKSVLTTACRLSCDEYVGSFNAENLAYRQSSNDEAAIMRWAMLARFKRLLFSNELKNTTDLNGNMIKKISSGGDSIVARCYGGNETEFILHFLAIIMANDIPKIKPYDDAVNARCKVFGYNKQFVEEVNNEDFELLMDKNIEKEMLTERFQRCFMGLLIKEYLNFTDNGCVEDEPVDAIISKQNWIKEEKSFVTTFMKDFDLTNDVKDYIVSEDLQKWLDEKKLGISMTKFGIELNKHCKINNLENICSKQKKINGKNKQVWCGIKLIQEMEDSME